MTRSVILWADNDSDYLDTRAERLTRYGYRVIKANSWEEAQRRLRASHIDLAILDLRLRDDDDDRDLSGLMLARNARRTLPKIILTQYPSHSVAAKALVIQEDGLPDCLQFVSKDLSMDALVAEIEQALTIGQAWLASVEATIRGVNQQISQDYNHARQQARINYFAALAIALFGISIIYINIIVATGSPTGVTIVGIISGIVTEVVSVLFFTRVDKANERMDSHHRERITNSRYEMLLRTCEGFESAKTRALCRENVVQTALSYWLGQAYGDRQSSIDG